MEKNPNEHVKHKRKLFGSVVDPKGFIFSHTFTETQEYNPETKKWKRNGRYMLSLLLCFYWLGSRVDIHNNTDSIKKSFDAYHNKVKLVGEMAEEAYNHLESGEGPLVVREFLNDADVNDGFGATLFIHVDGGMKSNYCIFEVSSCYKKYRYGCNPKDMKIYLRNLMGFIYDIQEDLAIIKKKIDQVSLENKDDGH